MKTVESVEKYSKITLASYFVAFVGVALSVWGASWDITAHLLRTPETFFTPSHLVLYTGVGISLISALINAWVLARKKELRKQGYVFGSKLIIVGAVFQIIAGPGDFYWHEMFGLDGLLSPTHLVLALGILMTSIGVLVGMGRIRSDFGGNNRFISIMLPISFGVFWFNVMWMIFFFVLPISEGETHNFNPDPHVAIVLAFLALPFTYSVVFWSASKSINRFGAASAAALAFVVMNITSNILTSENLFMFLPMYIVPLVATLGADYIIYKNNNKFIQMHKNKIAGSILGSVFFMFSFPMLGMTFLEIYVYNDVFPYDVLHTSTDLLTDIWLMSIVPGAIAGSLGIAFASRKLGRLVFNVNKI